MTIPEKIAALRAAMHDHKLTAYIVSDVDPHQSEYVAERWQGRSWLSGFDGSAGVLVVTEQAAKLWTDSRYFIQAEQQLAGTGIDLMAMGEKNVPTITNWLLDELKSGDTLGRAGELVSVFAANNLEKELHAADIRIEYRFDLLDEIWADRPPAPASVPFAHEPKFTEHTRAERLARIRTFISQRGLDHYLLVGLDEIAWTLCVRGEDVAYNPLVVSYLLISAEQAVWFCGVKRVPAALRQALAADSVLLADYPDVYPALQRINATDEPLGLDPTLASVSIYQAAGGSRVQSIESPVAGWKSIKGEKEINHLRRAMARDGIALLRLRRWLDSEESRGTDEVAIANHLTALRAEGEHYFGDSFPAIVGYEGNGAIVHYRARPESCATLKSGKGMLLIDSGGQYFDGTTDITRTFHLGQPSAKEKKHYTLVLQGHIDLAMARFPEGTVGRQLDILARNPLWQEGLNYGHGTGHGVGYFLNVHEGPMGIRGNHTKGSSRATIQAGQVLSNEPGYYPTGEYGIRIENLVLVKPAAQDGWLEFEDLTVFPLEKKLVDFDRLTTAQRKWLVDYHEQVLAALRPLLTDQAEIAWLEAACGGWG